MEPISDAAFAAFVEGLDSDVRQEFFYANGGTETHLRMVAVVDRLLATGEKFTIQDAYRLATGVDKDAAERAAYKCWHHPAVEAIMLQLQHRARIAEWAKIELAWGRLVREQIERGMARDASLKDRELAVKSGYMFGQRAQQSEVAERADKTRRALEAARAASANIIEIPTREQVALLFKELAQHYPTEQLSTILAENTQKKLPGS